MKALYNLMPDRIHLLTSTTTRSPDPRDLRFGDEFEYEHISEEAFERAQLEGAFLGVFGNYGAHYGTRARRFKEAISSEDIYLAALFVPAVELFWEKATEMGEEVQGIDSLLLDLPSEEIRLERLRGRGETNEERFKPELETWRKEVRKSSTPFVSFDASKPPGKLAEEVCAHFKY
jgi:guanylate kinase